MKKTFILVFCLLAFAKILQAQVATEPLTPVVSKSVKVIFDATQGNKGLMNYTGDVYVHTGLITSASSSGSDWKYVVSQWGENLPKTKLTRTRPNVYELEISPDLFTYYNAPANTRILKMAFVFRSSDGNKTGKTADGGDIFVDVSEFAFNIAITTPQNNQIFNTGRTIEFSAAASDSCGLTLLLNGTNIASESNRKSIAYTLPDAVSGNYLLKATAVKNGETAMDSIKFVVRGETPVAPVPSGLKDGINYYSDDSTKVGLVLPAPLKQYVYVLGDFNNWEFSNDYMMKHDTANKRFWMILENLVPRQEYAFQYQIDSNIRVADAYAEKILDPWNDKYIPASIYPNIKAYPEGKADGMVSVLQTNKPKYVFQHNFEVQNPQNLVIYEALIRDFTGAGSLKALYDSLDYLQNMGVTAIELMPVQEFDGNNSWGYNPCFFFALDKAYATENFYKQFIDECHRRGIAVIFDVVYNHATGNQPFAKMYWDAANGRPAANNPWFNVAAPHPYSVFNDFNHESVYTREFVKQSLKHLLNEYKIDGFRFDLTKGFTNKVSTEATASNYDASRIAILCDYHRTVVGTKPNAIMILEHFCDNREEKELSDSGMMVWGNLNYALCESVMGYTENSDMSGLSYKYRGWNQPNIVGYGESHDEERMMYKASQWGKKTDTYDVKNKVVALSRGEAAALMLLSVPGPKMIWQFGELGYDYSINHCENGTISDNCRTNPKPVRWDYDTVASRKRLYAVYVALAKLKTQEQVFRTTDFTISLSGGGKSVVLRDSTMNVAAVANFETSALNYQLALPKTGWWYDCFSGDSVNITDVNHTFNLDAGEYHLWLTKPIFVKLPKPSDIIVRNREKVELSEGLTVRLIGPQTAEIRFKTNHSNVKVQVFNTAGREIKTFKNMQHSNGEAYVYWENVVKSTPVIISVTDGKKTISQKVIFE